LEIQATVPVSKPGKLLVTVIDGIFLIDLLKVKYQNTYQV